MAVSSGHLANQLLESLIEDPRDRIKAVGIPNSDAIPAASLLVRLAQQPQQTRQNLGVSCPVSTSKYVLVHERAEVA